MREGWEYRKLGEVCVQKKMILRASKQYAPNELINYIDISSIDNKQNIILSTTPYVFCDAPSRAQQIVEKGDILVSLVRPNLKNIAIVRNDGNRLVASSGFCVVRTTNDISNNYIFYVVRGNSFTNFLLKRVQGANYPAVREEDIKDYIIPIPPLPEQERIVSELDLLSSIIEKKKAQLKEYDQLAQSIFYDMFGDLYNTTFPIRSLQEVCEFIKDGTHQTPTYTEDKKNGVRFLSAKDVVGGYINWNNIKYIPKELHEELYKRIAPQRNDLLLCKNGTTGICAIVETDVIFDIYVSLALLRPHKPFCPKYLLYAINNPYTKQQFDDSLKGVGVPNLHLGEIKKARIIYPLLELQQQFAEKIESIERQKELIKQSIAEAETLFNSRMEYWFA